MKRADWIKKLVMVAAITAAVWVPASADNLVQNPGFESWTGGTPDNWSHDSGINVEQCSVADSVHGGSYSARVTLTTQNQSNADFYSDEFAVTAGATYEISVWIFDNDPAGNGRIVVWWYDIDHNYLSGDYLKYSSDSPEWQQVIDTVTAPDNAAYAKFDIRFYDVSSSWDGDALFYIDDAEFASPSTNQPPTISNIQQSPTAPTSSDDVTVTADITDPDGDDISKDSLWYRVFDGSWGDWTALGHTSTSPYTYTIPAQSNHDSVEYYLIAEDDQGNRSESDHYKYYISDDPVIQNVTQSPAAPTSSDVVTVTADITDPNDDLATDSLFYSTNGGTTYDQLYHSSVSGNTYTYEIPALSDGTTVEYFVMAKDAAGNRVTSETYSYTVQDVYPPVINEIMYNPDDGSLGSDAHYEWVEIYNPNDEPYNVSNWVFTDYESDFTIPENTSIPAYGFLVIAKDTDSVRGCVEYQDDLGSENDILLGNGGFNLSNSGEDIALKDNSGTVIDHVTYGDDWGADGNGPSLELKDPFSDNNDGSNWDESDETYGTPGEPNSTYSSDNCVSNADFESWGASGPIGWDVETGATVTQETQHRRMGSKSARIDNSESGRGIVQRFDVQQNAAYDLRVWVYPSGAADNIRVFMIFKDGVGTVIDSIGPLTATEVDKWQLIRRQGNVPAATQMYLKIRGYNSTKGTSGYVDDVYFQSAGALSVEERPIKPITSVAIRALTFSDRVEFVVPYKKPVEMEIYTVDGRRTIVLRGQWRLRLPTERLKSGIYFALAKADGKVIGRTKFVVAH